MHIHGPKDAARLGIEVVYQDLALCDNLDVVQNMYLGREEHNWFQQLNEPTMEQQTAETLKSLAVTTIRSIRQPVATLSGGQRQSVAVAKAVQWNSKLVILDEPTAALGVAQTEQVLALVAASASQGSRRDADLAQPARRLRDRDRITVLRLGRNVGVFERAQDDAAGGRRGDHRRAADEGLRDPATRRREPRRDDRRRRRRPGRAPPLEEEHRRRARQALPARAGDNLRSGNLGAAPARRRDRRSSSSSSASRRRTSSRPTTSSTSIMQMAGTAMLAYGVVFVLLLGEIDLSIGYVAGIGALGRGRAPARRETRSS